MATPPTEPHRHQERPRCGRPRKDGQPCRAWAGHGADDPLGPCSVHGGTTTGREKQLEDTAAAALRWVQLSRQAAQTPLTPAERLERLQSARLIAMFENRRKRRAPAASDPNY